MLSIRFAGPLLIILGCSLCRATADPLNLPIASGGSVRCVNERFGPVGETLEVNHCPSALLGAAGVNSVAAQGQLYVENCNIFSGARVTDLSARTTININTRQDPYRNATADGINDDVINVTMTGSRARFLILALMGSTSSMHGTNPLTSQSSPPAYRNRRVVITIEHSTLRLFAIEVRDRFMPNNYSSLYYYGNRPCQESVNFDCQRRKILDEDYAAVTIILRNNSFIEGRTWNDIEHLIVFGSSSDKSGGIAIYVAENSIEYGDVANSGAGIVDIRVGTYLENLILHLSANNVSIKNTNRPMTMPTALVYFHEGLDLRSPRVVMANNNVTLSTDVGLGALISVTAWLGVVALSGWTGYSAVVSQVPYTSNNTIGTTQRFFARTRVSELIVRSNTVAGGSLFVGAALQVGAWSTVRFAHNTIPAPLNISSPAARADIFNTTDRVAVLAPTGRLELRSLRVLAPRQAPSALVRRLVNSGNGQVVLCTNYFERVWYNGPVAALVAAVVGQSKRGGGCTTTATPTRSQLSTSSRTLRDSHSRSAIIITSTHTKTLTISTNKTRQSNTTRQGNSNNNTNTPSNVDTDSRSRSTPLEPPTTTASAVTDLLVIIGAFTAVFSPFLFDTLGGVQLVAVLAAMPCGAPGAGGAGAMRVFLSPLHVGGGRTAAVAGLLVLLAAVVCAYGILLAVAAAALRSVRRAQQLLKHPQIFALLHALALPGLAFESAQLLYGNERPTASEQALGALVLIASLASVAAYPAISSYFHHRVAAIGTTTVTCRLDSEALATAVPRVVSAALVPPMAWAPEVLASPRCVYGSLRVQRGRALRWLSAHNVARSVLVAVIAAVRPSDADHCSVVLGAVAAVCVGHAAIIAVMRPYRVPAVNVAQGCVSALAAALAVVGAAHGPATAGSALAVPLVVTAFAGVLCAVAAHVLAESLDLFSTRKSQRRSLARKGKDSGGVEIIDGDDVELRHHTDSCSTPSTDPQKLHRPDAPPASSVAVAAHSGTIEESDVVMVDGNNQREYLTTEAREVEHAEARGGGISDRTSAAFHLSYRGGTNPLLAPLPCLAVSNNVTTSPECRDINANRNANDFSVAAPGFSPPPPPLLMAAHQHSSIVGTSDARRQQLQQQREQQFEQHHGQQHDNHDSHPHRGGSSGATVLPASVSDGRGGGVFYIDGRLFHLPAVYIPTSGTGDGPLALLTAQSAPLTGGGGGGSGHPRNPNSFSARTFEPDISAEGGGQNTDGTGMTTDARSMVAFERFERSRFV